MRIIFYFLVFVNLLAAQTYSIGDTVEDFSKSICSNGEGDLSFYSYNGAENDGGNFVIWINFFTSW